MRFVRAFLAAAALLMVVVAPPVVLVVLIGDPRPAGGLAWDAPLTDEAILGLLTVIAWLFWLQLLAAVLSEAVAACTRDRVPVSAPLTFTFQRQLARRLIAAIAIGTVTLPAFSSPGPAVALTVAHVHDPRPVAVAPSTLWVTPASGSVTVMRLDTLWSISERALGDGARWHEIAALNEGRVMPDGARFVSADNIRPGWQLLVPAAVSAPREGTVTVRAGESLSSIAERELGDPMKWRTLYAANKGTIGADPDLVEPGLRLRLPSAPVAPEAVRPPGPEAPQGLHGDERRDPQQPVPPMAPPVAVPDSAPHVAHPQTVQASDSAVGLTAMRALFATAICLAAGLASVLAVNRRRQLRHRRPGRTIHEPPRPLQKVERAIVEAAQVAECQVRFVDLALRSLSLCLRGAAAPLPDLGVAILDRTRLTLLFTSPTSSPCPAPWTPAADGCMWSIETSAELDERCLEQPAPYPGLVTVGHDAGDAAIWMLDLESLGEVTVSGPRHTAEQLIRYVVAELAVNDWSVGTEVLLTEGLAYDLIGMNPERLRASARESARRRASVKASEGDGISGDVLTRRRDDIATDGTAPLLVVTSDVDAADPPGDVQPRAGVASLVLTSTRPGVLSVTSEGSLSLHGFTSRLVASLLPDGVGGQLAELLTETRQTNDELMLASSGSSTVAAMTTVDGALRPELTLERSPEGEPTALLPLPDQEYLECAATTADDLAILAAAVPLEISAQVIALDPTLDADLEAWFDPESDRPKLRVLGPVDVRARSGGRDGVPNIGGTVELIVYLACRENGVTKDRAAEDLNWSGSTVQNRARDARRVLGQRSDGSDWLPDASRSDSARRRGVATYQLHSEVLVDADLFRRLRARAAARGADGMADLVKALTLVAGQPFDQLRRSGYGWLLEGDRLDHHLSAAVVDVAHIVVTQALATESLDVAREACRVGRLADPFSEVVQLDREAVSRATTDRQGPPAGKPPTIDDDVAPRTERLLRGEPWTA